ncbi:MAG: selenide, water dikinase SelD, partial [Nitriliruptorales bacterium]|nr:selenide, water dikinase SelD [Nitriliruptorales bacterium]
AVLDAAVTSMLRSNAVAAEVALGHGARAMTDVTGFGLLGHLRGMLEASGVDAVIEAAAVPVLDGLEELVTAGAVPGGTYRNLAWIREQLEGGDTTAATLAVLADPQTSGGLLFAAEPAAADSAVAALRAGGHVAAVVGHARQGRGVTHLASPRRRTVCTG